MSRWLEAVKGGRRLVLAHRGGRSLAPENTLEAARKGFSLGADGWELDVRLSADTVPVVIHDAGLSRTTDAGERLPGGRPWEVEDLDLETLRELDAGTWFVRTDPFGRIEAGEVPPEEARRYRGAMIPTLAQALELTREQEKLVNVEIKDMAGKRGHGVVAERVAGEIARAGMEDRILVSSFNPGYLTRVRALLPGLPLGLLNDRAAEDPLSLVRSVGADFYHPRGDTVSPEQVESLALARVPVLVWTINRPEEMERFRAAGAAGVITDFPQLFKGGRS